MIPSLSPIATRCTPVDSDMIRTMTEAEWRAFVAGKYPDFDGDADDFTSGPANPLLATIDEGNSNVSR